MTDQAPKREWILNVAGVKEDQMVAMYPYGSRVYGTNTFYSDYDYIMVVKDSIGSAKDAQQYDSMNGDISVHTYLESSWEDHLANHKIFAMECNSLFPIPGMMKYTLDLALLRKEISSKASNSWVKCKKKLTVEPASEFHTGIKSLFHSFRIPMFGIQIAQHGKVVNFTAANHIWDELRNHTYDTITWDELNAQYKSRHNELMSEFRTYASKE